MKNLHILIPRHYDFNSSHHSSIWLDSIMPELSKHFSIKITWFYYSPTKIEKSKLKNNENIVQIQDFKNANEVIQKIQPDLILDSEFPSLIDLSFLAAAKNNSFYVRKYSNHKIFKSRFNPIATFSHLKEDIIQIDNNEIHSTKRGNFLLYKYKFFINSLFSSKLTFFNKLYFLVISFKWNFITERPAIHSKLQSDLELLNSNLLKEILIKKGYSVSKLLVTGNPIFDSMFKKINQKQKIHDGKLKILIAPYQYYGKDNNDIHKNIIKEIIEKIIEHKEKFSLVVKLHPSIPYFKYFKNLIHSIDDSIPVFQKGSIESYINDSDIMITNGMLTSATIPALILKKPVIFCNFYNLYSYDEYKNVILECNSSSKLDEIILNSYNTNEKNHQNIENFLKQYYFKTDGLSSQRVVKALVLLLKR